MNRKPKFLANRICLNVLAGSVDNARDCYDAAEGNILIGVLSKNYDTVQEAFEAMQRYQSITQNALSIGLGGGDPNQSLMVSRLAEMLQPQHVNQVFTGVSTSRTLLAQDETFINALVSPTGTVGMVNIATGPLSSQMPVAAVPIETAIALLKDLGASSIKYFPMRGLETIDEYRCVAKACAQYGFALEPTGGIDVHNFEAIIRLALEEGVPQIIPHVYSSIIDKRTGLTCVEDVRLLFSIMKKLTDEC